MLAAAVQTTVWFVEQPPTVEYSLTPLGTTLVEPLAAIRAWAEEHIEELQAARDAHAREKPAVAVSHETDAHARTRTQNG